MMRSKKGRIQSRNGGEWAMSADNRGPVATDLTAEEERVLRSVLSAMRQIRFGSIQVTVHDGKVVQIERLEKERF